MSKLLTTDAAYALGEEAFRAGYEAAIADAETNNNADWHHAWSQYEPSEAVKDLI